MKKLLTKEMSLDQWCELIDIDTNIVLANIRLTLKNNEVLDLMTEAEKIRVIAVDKKINLARLTDLLEGDFVTLTHPVTKRKITFSAEEASFILSSVVMNQIVYVLYESYNVDKIRMPKEVFEKFYKNYDKEMKLLHEAMNMPKWVAQNSNRKKWNSEYEQFVGSFRGMDAAKIYQILD